MVLAQPRGKLGASAKIVACVLAEHMDWERGSCDPGKARIAAQSSLARSTVQAALHELRAQGFLSIVYRSGRDGLNGTNVYVARLPSWLVVPPANEPGF